MLTGIEIAFRPCREPHRGMYEAWLDDRLLGRWRDPEPAAARLLTGEGMDPTTPVSTRHHGSATVAFTSSLGRMAPWRVSEPDDGRTHPRFVKWRAFPGERFSGGRPIGPVPVPDTGQAETGAQAGREADEC